MNIIFVQAIPTSNVLWNIISIALRRYDIIIFISFGKTCIIVFQLKAACFNRVWQDTLSWWLHTLQQVKERRPVHRWHMTLYIQHPFSTSFVSIINIGVPKILHIHSFYVNLLYNWYGKKYRCILHSIFRSFLTPQLKLIQSIIQIKSNFIIF